VPERDRAQQVEAGRDPETLSQFALAAEHPEEQRPQSGVFGCEQERHHRHRRVDRPIRDRPRRRTGTEAGPGLVGFGVTVDVRLGVGERQGDHRCGEQVLPAERIPLDRRQRRIPELRRLLALQHHEMPSLGLARAGRPRRQLDQTVEHVGFDPTGVERTGHPARADDLGELGHRIAVERRRQRFPSLRRSSAIVHP
jgi:hypothetical protein